ncbi:protease SohB [Pseudoalteromonas sp. T1lg65]|uniref:protease SohB n=1 Tax=Pseudoalteromonas sp. T1lg65 TaxID=2077101 RepID=UPI003F7A418C
MAFLFEYGLFVAKAFTLLILIALGLALVLGIAQKPKSRKGEVEIEDLSEQLDEAKLSFQEQTLDKKALKKLKKADSSKSAKEPKPNAFVIHFHGSIDAHEVSSLREEVNAVLTIADPQHDQVIVTVESGGGVVHGYGLCASQLARFKQANIPLTVCVDKVAASGGYMMACVAEKIVAAPFAIIGSIGVIAQIPNFNRLLKKNDVDFEQITAGEYKRTLTLFGENTDKGREKFKQEIEQTHSLFKDFVAENRPNLDLTAVATGEHWFGTQALELGLVDAVATSDDVIIKVNETYQLYTVKFKSKQNLSQKLGLAIASTLEAISVKALSKLSKDKY